MIQILPSDLQRASIEYAFLRCPSCGRIHFLHKMLGMQIIEQEEEADHPFPNAELNLIMKLNREKLIPVEDIAMLSNLIHKYLNLRSQIFHKF